MSARGETGGRLSALDGSFLRLESAQSPMHVGWSAVFAEPQAGERPTLEALRERVAGRLHEVPWCRWRLQDAPFGLSEPRWVDDGDFDLEHHVLATHRAEERVSHEGFAALRDKLLSQPLDRSRALWQIFLVPQLEDGRVALIGKVHHALVDGIAALQIVRLFVDATPDAPTRAPAPWRPSGPQHPLGWVLEGLTQTALDGLGVLRAGASALTHPAAGIRGAVQGAGSLLAAAREDILPRAPAWALDAPTGPRRSLVGYHASRSQLRAARAGGGTANDVGLTVVAGALRRLALQRAERPRAPLKTMIPVSMRGVHEAESGNRIAMVYIELPVHLGSSEARRAWVRAQTRRLKLSARAQGVQTLFDAGALVPAPLRSPVVKAMASPRVFNLTVSQSPAPRGALYLLGCELQEVYSVVPIAQGHALSIGLVRYRQELFFGCYFDPDAVPEVRELPALLEAEMLALGAGPVEAQEDDPLPSAFST